MKRLLSSANGGGAVSAASGAATLVPPLVLRRSPDEPQPGVAQPLSVLAGTDLFERLSDGLPTDAWISPLSSRRSDSTTDLPLRPLSADTQQKALRVGRCLDCHRRDQAAVFGRFARALERMPEIEGHRR